MFSKILMLLGGLIFIVFEFLFDILKNNVFKVVIVLMMNSYEKL